MKVRNIKAVALFKGYVVTKICALANWCAMAEASGLAPFQRLARGFLKQSARVCGFVKHGLTSGLIEGFNNLIARIIHKVCGMRDLDYLELKLRHRSVMRS